MHLLIGRGKIVKVQSVNSKYEHSQRGQTAWKEINHGIENLRNILFNLLTASMVWYFMLMLLLRGSEGKIMQSSEYELLLPIGHGPTKSASPRVDSVSH